MKRIVLRILVLLATALFVLGVRYVLKKEAHKRREASYQFSLRSYAQALKPGMTRKEVEDYFRANKKEFRQMCCVDPKECDKGSWDDLVKLGEEDAPWYCGSTNVYVGFQFIGAGHFNGMWYANDLDRLRTVTIYRALENCL